MIYGGNELENNCLEPTILLNPNEDSIISKEEIFGPATCIYTYSKIEEVIKKINKVKYTFQASVFSKDINIALKLAKKIKGTTLMINDHTAFRLDWMPFGGMEKSGLGIGGIKNNIDDLII